MHRPVRTVVSNQNQKRDYSGGVPTHLDHNRTANLCHSMWPALHTQYAVGIRFDIALLTDVAAWCRVAQL